MSYRLRSSCLILLLAAACASGQIIGFPFPGGGGRFPGGGGGGSPFPGGGRRTNANNGPVQNLDGMLRRISSNELVIESDDNLVTTVSLSSGTRYYLQPSDVTIGNGNNPPSTAKRGDFQPGDHVTVEATQDNNSYYHATKLILVSTGTAADKNRAARPVDSASSSSSKTSSSDSTSDDDRPRLHRADSSSSSSSSSSTSAPSSNSSSTQSSNNSSDSDQPPTLRRSSASSRPASTNTPANTDDPVQTASASRPSIHADDVGGVTRLPDAPAVADDDRDSVRSSPRRAGPAAGDDPVIENAREAAFSFVETLPNYVVKQFTTRYGTEAARGGKTSWRAIDTVTADVVSENGTEAYKNILVNGKPPREAIEKTGAWSTGEYASLLQDVLAPQTDADFHGQRTTTIVNRAAYRYDFTVQRSNSHWHVYAMSESYVPEYTGTIWIDKQNYRVLRIELAAQKLPRSFLLDTVESAVDYDYFTIGEGKFLLPAHSEALSCVRGTGDCTRNVIDFRNYKKFSAETSITFDADK
jgi:hypothetical protein